IVGVRRAAVHHGQLREDGWSLKIRTLEDRHIAGRRRGAGRFQKCSNFHPLLCVRAELYTLECDLLAVHTTHDYVCVCAALGSADEYERATELAVLNEKRCNERQPLHPPTGILARVFTA